MWCIKYVFKILNKRIEIKAETLEDYEQSQFKYVQSIIDNIFNLQHISEKWRESNLQMQTHVALIDFEKACNWVN